MFRSDSMIERTLQEDLAQALDGLDPLEMLLQDPNLAKVAEEMLQCQNDAVTSQFPEASYNTEYLVSANPSPPYSPEIMDPIIKTEKKKRRRCKNGETVLCKVCDGLSEGHSYYGAMACNSCRSFFFRSIKNGDHYTFLCSGLDESQKCTIDSASWMSCTKCRFEKCLQMGMKIPSEPSTKLFEEEFMQNATFVKHLRNSLALSTQLSIAEKTLLRDMTIKYFTVKFGQRIRFFTSHLDIFKEMLEQLYQGKIFTLQSLKLWEEYLIFGQVKAYSDGDLCQDRMIKRDRERLLKQNCILANEFSDAFLMHEIKYNEQDYNAYAHMILDGIRSMDKTNYNKVHEEISHDGKLNLLNIRYETVYDHKEWAIVSVEDAKRHKKLVDKIGKMAMGKQDPVLLMLVSFIIMYTSDFVELDCPKDAEQVQMVYASYLHRYLKGKDTPRGDLIFRECMMASGYARELREFREAAYKKKFGKV